MELGCAATLIEVVMVLFASDMTSMRLAVKLAMYSTPRASSSATSAASPPMGTTVPKVPARADAAIKTIHAIATAQDFQRIGNSISDCFLVPTTRDLTKTKKLKTRCRTNLIAGRLFPPRQVRGHAASGKPAHSSQLLERDCPFEAASPVFLRFAPALPC